MVRELRDFLMRGNILDLAVAVVMGGAFKALIDSLVADILMPIVAAIIGKPDFSALTFTINGSVFTYGNFINAIVAFISVAIAIFFFVLKPVSKMNERMKKAEAAAPTTRQCPECMGDVPIAATRCMHCAQPLPPA